LLAHGPHLYEETVAVPLIMVGFGPHTVPVGVRTEPVSLLDVLPTLIDAAKLPPPVYPLPGRSLLVPPFGDVIFAQTLIGNETGIEGFTEKLCILDEGWKLIRTPANDRLELYDLNTDPKELHDLAAQETARRDGMAARLEKWRAMTAA